MSTATTAGWSAPSRPRRGEQLRWAHPEWGVALAAAAAWATVVVREPLLGGPTGAPHAGMAAHAGAAMPPVAPGPAVLAAVPMSAVMAAAMMLPSVLPAARAVALTSRWHRRQRALAMFTGAYLAVWTVFGVAVTAVLLLVGADAGPPWVGPVALVAAAAWELSPGKPRHLRACHRLSPSGNDGWSADLACVRAGLRHARACLGACWALMVAVLLVSTGTVLVMVVLTAVIWAEKVLAAGPRLGARAALLIVATAAVLALA
jgi:predicted metal-binding membrane protein